MTRRRWIIAIVALAVLVPLGIGAACAWCCMSPAGTEPAPPKKDEGSTEDEPAASSTADLSALRKMVLPALVTIHRSDSRGTGFLIDGNLVVTAYHVAPKGQKATVVYEDGEQVDVVEHVAYDAQSDLAVLRTGSARDRQSLMLAAALPGVGAKVAAFRPGDSQLQGNVLASGKSEVSGGTARHEMLHSTLNAVPGWSGGPVVNMEGEVVGVNSRLDGSLFEAEGLKIATGSAAAPVTALNQLLAIVKLTTAINADPKNPQKLGERAALYFLKGDLAEAIADYTALLSFNPKDANAFLGRANAYAELHELDKAAADYTSSLAIAPHLVEACRGRAAVFEKKGDWEGAILDYSELVQLLPKDQRGPAETKLVEILRSRAQAQASHGRCDLAIADITEVIGLRPFDAESHRFRAELYHAVGQNDKSIADYTDAIQMKPNSASLYRSRGEERAAKGEHAKAIADFTEAIRCNPQDAEAYCARGAVHGSQRNFRKAIADFSKAIDLNHSLGKAYFDRGSAYKAQEELGSAKLDFERAMTLGYMPQSNGQTE